MNEPRATSPLILYDGICRLCTSIIVFVIRRDSKKVFRFASLQSRLGQTVLKNFELPLSDFKTFVLVDQKDYYTKSTAVLQVIKKLDGFWPILYFFVLIPAPIRNFIYDRVAKNRYHFFGKRKTCLVPTDDIKDRFLDLE